MTIRTAKISSLSSPSHHTTSTLTGRNRAFEIALTLSLCLHVMLFFSTRLLKPHRFHNLNENLVEVKLVRKKPESAVRPRQKAKPAVKPRLKQKRKLKRKKKSAAVKKHKVVTKTSSLARRPSRPKKKTPPEDNHLNDIKKRLARQREEAKLNAIRQRLHNNLSPAARARQASLTQTYNRTLTAWIMRNWHLPEYLLNSGLEATISLTITASGTLLTQKEERLSGNSIFDHAMRQAIADANPFPPFPEELTIPQEEFVINFNPRNISKEN